MPNPWQAQTSRPGSGPPKAAFDPKDPTACVPEPPRQPDGQTGRGRLTIINGLVRDCRVKQHPIQNIDAGPLMQIRAIVVHQTDSYTAAGTLQWWSVSPLRDGAHFLIDKDGTIFQTMSIIKKCHHVGKIYSACYAIHKCSKAEESVYDKMPTDLRGNKPIGRVYPIEKRKAYPDRYP